MGIKASHKDVAACIPHYWRRRCYACIQVARCGLGCCVAVRTDLFRVCSIMSILRGLRSAPPGREAAAGACAGASCLMMGGAESAAAMPGGMNFGT